MAAQRKIKTISNQPYAYPLPEQEPHRHARTHSRRVARKSFYNLKWLLALCGVGVFALMFLQLYMDSQINHLRAQAEWTRIEINNELIINEQLSSQVSELSRPARIIEIGTQSGLTNEGDIIRIQR